MKYIVTMDYRCTETYEVEADSPEEAADNCMCEDKGELILTKDVHWEIDDVRESSE